MTRQVCFKALSEGDKDAVSTACEFLKQDGFIFLDYSKAEQFRNRALPSYKTAAEYLWARGGKGSRTALHGHVSGKYKDSLRFLSGNQFRSSDTNLSTSSFFNDAEGTKMVAAVECLAEFMDESAKQVISVLAKPLFSKKDIQEVGDFYELPLFQSNPRNKQSYGLLDIVWYHNQRSSLAGKGDDKGSLNEASSFKPEIVVAAHQDPGLLVLALPEMAPGLELRSISGIWISPPKGFGVLWAGRAASDVLTPCYHRVRLPPVTSSTVSDNTSNGRVACWHEVCTAGQIAAPMLQHLKDTNQELALGEAVVGTSSVLDYLRRIEDHEKPAPPPEQRRKEQPLRSSATKDITKSAIKKQYDDTFFANEDDLAGLLGLGMPMSKREEYIRFQPTKKGHKKTKTAAKKKRREENKKNKGSRGIDPPGAEPVREGLVPVGLPIGKVIHLRTDPVWGSDDDSA